MYHVSCHDVIFVCKCFGDCGFQKTARISSLKVMSAHISGKPQAYFYLITDMASNPLPPFFGFAVTHSHLSSNCLKFSPICSVWWRRVLVEISRRTIGINLLHKSKQLFVCCMFQWHNDRQFQKWRGQSLIRSGGSPYYKHNGLRLISIREHVHRLQCYLADHPLTGLSTIPSYMIMTVQVPSSLSCGPLVGVTITSGNPYSVPASFWESPGGNPHWVPCPLKDSLALQFSPRDPESSL